eukprot:CFRG0541T1
MKFSTAAIIATALVSSSYAIDPECLKVQLTTSIGEDCESPLGLGATATIPTDGECVALSKFGSVKVTMDGEEATGKIYISSDCTGFRLANEAVIEENTCIEGKFLSFTVKCVETAASSR